MGYKKRIRTQEQRAELIEDLKKEHPATVAAKYGLARGSLRKYIHEAKAEETIRLKAQGFSARQIEDELSMIFERDGVQRTVVTYGK